MKNSIKYSFMLLAVSLLALSFTLSEIQNKTVKTESSSVVWKAYKVTGSHEGTIDLKSGSLTFDGDVLTGGEFVIDMSTIACTDLEGDYKSQLEGHLKSDDFFSVDSYATSKLVLSKVKSSGKNSYSAEADLTIKGKTNKVEFDLSVYGNKANASLKIDRTQYDVRYGSTAFFDGLKDKAIYDEFDLVVDLEF